MSKVVGRGERPDLDVDEYSRRIDIDPRLKDILARCWAPELANRPTMADVLALLSALDDEHKAKKPSTFSRFTSMFKRKDPI